MILGTKVVVDHMEETQFTGTLRGMGFVVDAENKIVQQMIIERDEPYNDPVSGGWIVYTVAHPDNVKRLKPNQDEDAP